MATLVEIKTTLSKLIGGLNTPTSGEIRILGESVKDMAVQRRASLVGYCYQNPDHQIFLNTARHANCCIIIKFL